MVSRPQGPDPPTGPLLEQAFTPKDNVPSLSGLVTFADEAIRGVKIGRRLTVYGCFTESFETLDLQEAKALLDELARGNVRSPRGHSQCATKGVPFGRR